MMNDFRTSDRTLSIATMIMMGSVFLSRVIGLFREIILAKFGGTSFEMDAYVTAFIIPELLNHFLAGGFLSITFIPIFQKYLISDNQEQAWNSFSNLICIGSTVFICIIPLAIIFTPNILTVFGPQIHIPQNYLLTVKLTRIILPAQLFFYWGAFLNAVQMAHKRFFLPALAPLGYNGGIIIGGILLGPHLGIEGFAWGVLGGAFLGNVMIQIPGAINCGMRFKPEFNIFHKDVSIYIQKTVPLVLGLGMTFSNEVFFRFFGSFLPEGGTSSVNYALRTMMMVVAVFGQASGVALYPFLSRLAVENRFSEMNALLVSVLNKIALYLIPISAILIAVSHPVITLLFERGEFSSQSTALTAGVFSIYCTGCFFFSAAIIIARSFYALQKVILPMGISTGIALGTIPLYIFFSHRIGAAGIAVAAVLGMSLQFTILFSIWIKQYSSIQHYIPVLLKLIKIVLISLTAAAFGFLITNYTSGIITFKNDAIQSIVLICITSVPALTAVFLLYEFTGVQSFKQTFIQFFRRS